MQNTSPGQSNTQYIAQDKKTYVIKSPKMCQDSLCLAPQKNILQSYTEILLALSLLKNNKLKAIFCYSKQRILQFKKKHLIRIFGKQKLKKLYKAKTKRIEDILINTRISNSPCFFMHAYTTCAVFCVFL